MTLHLSLTVLLAIAARFVLADQATPLGCIKTSSIPPNVFTINDLDTFGVGDFFNAQNCACSLVSATGDSFVMSNGLDSFCDLETKWFWLTVTTYQPAFQEGGSCVIFEDGTIVDLAPIGIVSSPEACFQACKAFSAAQYIPSGAPGYDCTCTDGSVSTMTVCSSDTTYLFIHPAGTAVGDNGLGPAPSGYVRKRAGRASAKFRLTSR